MFLTLSQFSLLCVLIGISLTINSYFKPHKIIKQQESKLLNSKKVELYIIRFIHYCTSSIAMLFFMVKINLIYDVYFMIFSFVAVSHWMIYGNECILTIREKTILDPSYKPGTSCIYEPFLVLINDSINGSQTVKLFYINILIVLLRLIIPAFYGPFTMSAFKKFYKDNY